MFSRRDTLCRSPFYAPLRTKVPCKLRQRWCLPITILVQKTFARLRTVIAISIVWTVLHIQVRRSKETLPANAQRQTVRIIGSSTSLFANIRPIATVLV